MYTAKKIANYIINRCSQNNSPVTNLKLQKILYFLWIDYYKETKKYLFNEPICAWQFGPVCPDVYYEYCSYGGFTINKARQSLGPLNNDDCEILNKSIDIYNSRSVSSLIEDTHQIGKPWYEIYVEKNKQKGIVPFSLIIKLEC